MKEIQLSQGKVALVDDDMFDFLNQWKWYCIKQDNNFYAVRKSGKGDKRVILRMHRVIINAKNGELVDHRNHNGLHNYRSNLRKCNHVENTRNQRKIAKASSVYKGVHWSKHINKWNAHIGYNYKRYDLGQYHKEIKAAKVYDQCAVELFREFACLNFPENNYDPKKNLFSEIQKERLSRKSSEYIGVSKEKDCRRYRASIMIKSKKIPLGYFYEEINAAKTYNEAVIKNGLKRKINCF